MFLLKILPFYSIMSQIKEEVFFMISNETVTLEKVLSEFKKISNQYEEDKIKFNKTVELLEHENHLLKEQLEFFKKKLFGKSSEKTKGNPNQISLFDMEEITQEETSETAVEVETITYTRKKHRVNVKISSNNSHQNWFITNCWEKLAYARIVSTP